MLNMVSYKNVIKKSLKIFFLLLTYSLLNKKLVVTKPFVNQYLSNYNNINFA